ncbi:PDGLE domain-containing protein [Halogeometricum sp. S1BR25-6]|uniref:PDGLE domain-containing protein n=1 Tax=Halogeometricum salsisoli TaxID=2950536 RepID=A0ABU2GH44_9EURY|nr:PDGLE domain-containing protein [Halogeometricum sp. S1BR25-6]MDS0300125.1 PDGLE domain-containing protein [Halogeometricum sp. S1BR25-6]
MNAVLGKPWVRRAVVALLVLVALAPVFGWASGAVGYAEPLENAAEETGAADAAASTVPALFPDYSVPGLGSSLGTLVSAVVGTALTLAVGVGAGRLLER